MTNIQQRLFTFASARVSLVLLIGASLLFAGCGKKSSAGLASAHDKEFQSATGEIKAGWEAASAAAKSHDYAAALTAVAKIANNPALTPAQSNAVVETATAVSNEMYERANKGDEAANNAIKELKKANGR